MLTSLMATQLPLSMLVTHKTYTTEGAGVLFEDEEDNYQFINTLDRMRVRYDDDGNPCGTLQDTAGRAYYSKYKK